MDKSFKFASPNTDISWRYIAGFFDGEGNIHMMRNNKKTTPSFQIMIRIYSSNKQILWDIKEFLGYGNVYESKKKLYELNISSKKETLDFLKGIFPYSIIKKPQIYFILNNYSFVDGDNNISFDIDKFYTFVTRKGVEKYRKSTNPNDESSLPNDYNHNPNNLMVISK